VFLKFHVDVNVVELTGDDEEDNISNDDENNTTRQMMKNLIKL